MCNLENTCRPLRRLTATGKAAGFAILPLLALATCASVAPADIDVNPAQPITRRVSVQLIQTATNDGSLLATVIGNASQRAIIETSIDTIWAQAGIDIAILPTINRYNNTFAYQGNAGSGTRPNGDLNTVFASAASAGGILSPDSLVLNLMLVNVVPAFAPLEDDHAAGYARVRGNGIMGFVGDSLLTFANGRDVIASVMAHEIGHNLGLNHLSGEPNLMGSGGQQLNTSQIDIARGSTFARTIAAQLNGDYNNNGVVDAADYAVWRKNQNTTRVLPNDPIGGTIGTPQYNQWRAQFGKTPGTGMGLTPGTLSNVPEPATSALVIFATAAIFLPRRRRASAKF